MKFTEHIFQKISKRSQRHKYVSDPNHSLALLNLSNRPVRIRITTVIDLFYNQDNADNSHNDHFNAKVLL